MTETNIGYLAIGALIGLAIGSLCYMLGGRKDKWRRRILGSAIISTTVIAGCIVFGLFNWFQLLIYLALFGGFSLGYGGTSKEKIFRRAIYCLGVCVSGAIMAWTLGGSAWALFILHLCVAGGSIFFAIKNPIHAAAEEVLVCVLLNLVLVFYPFIIGG